MALLKWRIKVIGLVTDTQTAMAALCRQYGVVLLDVFGSASTGAFDEHSSDIDFIVKFADMSPGIANRYLDFAEALERLFGQSVDVMFDGPIANPYLKQTVDASRENVFGRQSRNIQNSI
jgi:predicted nucleotidyltransferase